MMAPTKDIIMKDQLSPVTGFAFGLIYSNDRVVSENFYTKYLDVINTIAFRTFPDNFGFMKDQELSHYRIKNLRESDQVHFRTPRFPHKFMQQPN